MARDRHQSLSDTVNALLEQALGGSAEKPTFGRSAAGLPTVRLGTVITADDVRSLEDE